MVKPFLLALAALASAPAEIPPQPELPASGPAAMDIAGVRLGMSPAEVRAALAKAGYRIDRTDMAPDFDQEVASEVRFRTKGLGGYDGRPRAIGTFVATGAHGEWLKIDFAQWSTGALVSEVTFTVPVERQPAASFRAQVAAKYGRATLHVYGLDPTWCTPGDRDCTVMSAAAQPTLDASFTNPPSLRLRSGSVAGARRRAAVKAAADVKVAPSARSAF